MNDSIQTEVLPADRQHALLLRAHRITSSTAEFDDRFVGNHEDLKDLLEMLRAMGCAIVFTTGVWDLFHIGHGDYIRKGKGEAAKLCPKAEKIIMVVGVDTDALTKERKGPSRPIVPEDERYRVLGHLRSVDIITPQYKADTLHRLVQADVRVISESTGDLPDMGAIRGSCRELIILPPQSETSTTARVRRLALDGRLEAVKDVHGKLTAFLEEMGRELKQ